MTLISPNFTLKMYKSAFSDKSLKSRKKMHIDPIWAKSESHFRAILTTYFRLTPEKDCLLLMTNLADPMLLELQPQL